MVEDQSSRKVKKFIFSVSLFLLLTNLTFAKNFNLEKIVDLNGPWGSSFINNEELIITEKSGKIKINNMKIIFIFVKKLLQSPQSLVDLNINLYVELHFCERV